MSPITRAYRAACLILTGEIISLFCHMYGLALACLVSLILIAGYGIAYNGAGRPGDKS